MKFKLITTLDPEYPKELMLRWEVLDKPLGIPPGSEVAEEEKKSLHLVALENKQIVGCVLFLPEQEKKGRLFQMAISEEYRGKGFGRRLISSLENTVSKMGFKEVHLYALKESVGFYLRMGYHPKGELVLKKGLPYQLMAKPLLEEKEAIA